VDLEVEESGVEASEEADLEKVDLEAVAVEVSY
jgi:hypothetical protein